MLFDFAFYTLYRYVILWLNLDWECLGASTGAAHESALIASRGERDEIIFMAMIISIVCV